MDIFWTNSNLLLLSLSAFLSVVPVIAFTHLKKVPSVIKQDISSLFQKFYFLLVGTLFLSSLTTGLYIVTTYDLLVGKNLQELLRVAILLVFNISLLFTILAFKKQKLSNIRIFLHLGISSCVLVLAGSNNPFHLTEYLYIIAILAVFVIMRYVVGIINKNF